jgi:hypothetical protein
MCPTDQVLWGTLVIKKSSSNADASMCDEADGFA